MKVLLLLTAVFAGTYADISEILRGQNAVGGVYYHDNSGQYVGDVAGRYIHDDSGRYIHQDNPYIHDPNPHDPYEHIHVPPLPYQHVHIPHLPYEHIHLPYEHVDAPHSPYVHLDVPHQPYVHQQRTYLPPPTPKAPEAGYFYEVPGKSLPPEPFVPPPVSKPTFVPPPVSKPIFVPVKPTFVTSATTLRPRITTTPAPIRPFTVAPTASVKGGGPYRWNLFHTGEHKVEHPEYNLKVGLKPHS